MAYCMLFTRDVTDLCSCEQCADTSVRCYRSSVLIGGRARDDYCTRNLLRYQSGLRRGASCRRWENREYVCVMEDSGKGSRQATRDALLVAGGYSKCKYFNSVYLFDMKMNRWSEGPSVSQFRPYAGTALPL
ncbi:hypothetical protein EVAR_98623_1 [Eumeta japonica]|uniref:Uncharacterized protein n=1 Tax=Eumeta variegata TaxID=151549 RepID=A0A4C1XZ29_EUMVA|nr:hypothetical protein EVAR_98623_1 [Eumeta japonica]